MSERRFVANSSAEISKNYVLDSLELAELAYFTSRNSTAPVLPYKTEEKLKKHVRAGHRIGRFPVVGTS